MYLNIEAMRKVIELHDWVDDAQAQIFQDLKDGNPVVTEEMFKNWENLFAKFKSAEHKHYPDWYATQVDLQERVTEFENWVNTYNTLRNANVSGSEEPTKRKRSPK